MVAGFRNKGLEEIYLTGKTRRIGAGYVRKCVRILQSLEVAMQPEDMNIAGTGSTVCKVTCGDGPCASQDEMEKKNRLPPVHPGEIIREDILPQAGLSVTAAAKALGVSRQMVHDILAGRRPLSAVMCLRVSRLFGGPPEFWMRLQSEYDLKKAAQNRRVMERIARIVPVKPLEEVGA